MSELELCLAPGDVRALLRSPLIAARGWVTAAEIVWHDTPDHALEQGGALLARARGQSWLERLRPDPGNPAAWPPATPAPTEAAIQVADPAPVAAFRGRDRQLTVATGDAISAVRLRTGELRGITGTGPVARVSLSGEPAAVACVLPELARAVRLSVPRAGLAAEALALVRGIEPSPRFLGAPVIAAALPVTDVISAALGQLTDVLLHWSDRAGPDGTEAVHHMRVALRRVRSALSVFRPVAPWPALEAMREPLRALSATLGTARDWDVFLGGLGPEVAEACGSDPRLFALLRAARRRRTNAYDVLHAALSSPDFRQLALALASAASLRPWDWAPGADMAVLNGDAAPVGRAALDKRLRRVLRRGKHLADLSDPELHEVRKDCKKLRYSAELFAAAYPAGGVKRFFKRLAALQQRLGEVNDGAISAELLASLGQAGRGFAAGAVRGYVAARTHDARREAKRAFRTFRDVAPFWAEHPA